MGLTQTLRFITEHPLTVDHKLDAIARFVSWQVASRLTPGAIAVDFVGDARLLVHRGMTGATGNVYVGLHEFEDMAFLLHILRPEDLFVDVGANVGSYTVLAGKAVGARCLSFEPIPDTHAKLMDNVHLNGLVGRVDARCHGVGDQRAQLEFTSGLDCVNHVAEAADRAAGLDVVRVDVAPLDDLLGDQVPTLIKIDVEGFESQVLAGARKTLSRPELAAVIMETNGSGERYGVSDRALHQTMVEHGFSAFTYAPFARTLSPLNDRPNHGNSLYVRDPQWVGERVRSAPSFRVNHHDV